MDALRPLADAARAMGTAAGALYVIANNHFRGQAFANALQLKHLIQGIKPVAPSDLVAEYPGLRDVVTAKGDRIF